MVHCLWRWVMTSSVRHDPNVFSTISCYNASAIEDTVLLYFVPTPSLRLIILSIRVQWRTSSQETSLTLTRIFRTSVGK